MEPATSDVQTSRAAYAKDDAFDLEAGMAVYGPDGQKIGRVTEVAGFGATRLGTAPSQGTDARVTQAQSGTGYLKVNREEVSGPAASDLCVPFHGIQDVTAEHGVILNGTIISELRPDSGGPGSSRGKVTETQRGRWHRWLPGKRG